jgi:hypothetical protein
MRTSLSEEQEQELERALDASKHEIHPVQHRRRTAGSRTSEEAHAPSGDQAVPAAFAGHLAA